MNQVGLNIFIDNSQATNMFWQLLITLQALHQLKWQVEKQHLENMVTEKLQLCQVPKNQGAIPIHKQRHIKLWVAIGLQLFGLTMTDFRSF